MKGISHKRVKNIKLHIKCTLVLCPSLSLWKHAINWTTYMALVTTAQVYSNSAIHIRTFENPAVFKFQLSLYVWWHNLVLQIAVHFSYMPVDNYMQTSRSMLYSIYCTHTNKNNYTGIIGRLSWSERFKLLATAEHVFSVSFIHSKTLLWRTTYSFQ